MDPKTGTRRAAALLTISGLLAGATSADAMLSTDGTPLGITVKRPLRSHKPRPDRRLKVIAPYRARLERMAGCEASGNWHIATGNGFYGGLQFTLSSWRTVGGRGFPHLAGVREQKYRAVLLMRLQGWGAWPRCAYA